MGCGAETPEAPREPAAAAAPHPVPLRDLPRDSAVLDVAGFGEIRFELLADVAPRTVANFVELAERDFYDGTTFHRVVPGFMIQGGDPNTRDRDPRNDGSGRAERDLADEVSGVRHDRGIVSMANSGAPNSASSQFFIVVADSPHLDAGYSAFGRVTAGMEVADRIVAVERDVYGRWGPIDRPLENVVVRDVRIERVQGAGDSAPSSTPPVAPADSRG